MDPDFRHPEIVELLRLALAEDIGSGDVTSQSCVPEHRQARGTYFAREEMTVAGVELIGAIFDREQVELRKRTGDRVAPGEKIASVQGSARRLLERERVSLNILQRLSGIATN